MLQLMKKKFSLQIITLITPRFVNVTKLSKNLKLLLLFGVDTATIIYCIFYLNLNIVLFEFQIINFVLCGVRLNEI